MADSDAKLDGLSEPTRDEHARFLPGVVQPGARLFQPGQSGNPAGHSRGRRLTDAVLRLLDDKGVEVDEALARVVIKKALKGDIKFIELLYERLEGRVPQKADISLMEMPAAMSPERAAAAIRSAHAAKLGLGEPGAK